MRAFRRLVDAIDTEGSAALVTLTRVEGSSPREAGARMVVRPSGGFHGTIGGGALEWAALDAAQAALKQGRQAAERRSLALGPELAQCCGGRVEWRIETFDRRDLTDLSPIVEAESGGRTSLKASMRSDGRVERMVEEDRRGDELTASLPASEGWTEPLGESVRAVYLFGAGHVGRALALTLAPLPFAVRWIDSRREAFPAYAPANVGLIHAPEPTNELANAPDGALIVVMTPFARDRSRNRRGGPAHGSVRLCRPHRLGDEAGALPEPDARRGLVGRLPFETRLSNWLG